MIFMFLIYPISAVLLRYVHAFDVCVVIFIYLCICILWYMHGIRHRRIFLKNVEKKVQMLDKYNLHTASSLPSIQSETPSQTKPLSTHFFLSWHSNSVFGSAQTENEKEKKKILYRRIRRHK